MRNLGILLVAGFLISSLQAAERRINLSVPLDGHKTRTETIVGETATWTVNIEAETEDIAIEWSSSRGVIEQSEKYDLVLNRLNETSLAIRNLTMADAGIYKMTVFANGQQKSVSFSLSVREEPSYFVINYTFDRSSMAITCWVYAQPPVIGLSFENCKSGTTCQEVHKPKIWKEIFSYSVEDDGEKDLMAENAKPVTLYIKGIHKEAADVSLFPTNRKRYQKHMEQLQVSCTLNSEQNNIAPQIRWSWTPSSGSNIQLDASQPPRGMKMHSLPCQVFGRKSCSSSSQPIQMLVWRNVTDASDGTYTVSATDDVSQMKMALSFKITTVQEPVIYKSTEPELWVDFDEEVSMFCDVEGVPMPGAQWFKDGEKAEELFIKQTQTGSVLSIPSASSVDAGEYSCRFESVAGVAEKFFVMHVDEDQLNDLDRTVIDESIFQY